MKNAVITDTQNAVANYILKIYCQNSNSASFQEKYPNDFFKQTVSLLQNDSFLLSQKAIMQAQPCYPCISISYKKNGTFASMLVSKSANAPRSLFHKKSSLITDIYLDHSRLITDQSSYQ